MSLTGEAVIFGTKWANHEKASRRVIEAFTNGSWWWWIHSCVAFAMNTWNVQPATKKYEMRKSLYVWIIYKVDWELSGPLPLWIQEPDTLSTVKKSLQLGWKGLDPESSHSYTAIGLGCKLRASHDVKCFFFTHLFSFTCVYTPLYI